jgi:hypothetical protein
LKTMRFGEWIRVPRWSPENYLMKIKDPNVILSYLVTIFTDTMAFRYFYTIN